MELDIPPRWWTFAYFSLGLYFVYWLLQVVYNVYFHPLHKFPGPLLWTATDLPRYYHEYTGTLDFKLRDFHNKYGNVVRFTPTYLSTTDSAAFKDVYGYGKNDLVKDPTVHGMMRKGQTDFSIIQANKADHSRQRRQLAHAFSEKALRNQESLIQGYVNTLMAQLIEAAKTGEKVDIMHKYMYTTSDITSELAFGTSFNSLKDETMLPYVHLQDKFGPFIVVARLLSRFPLMLPILALILDRQAITMIKNNRVWVKEVVDKRLGQGVMEEKRDFLSYILKHKDEDAAMSDGEIRETSRTMIAAGAETTRTVLTTTTFMLLKHPSVLKKAQEEVRAAFPTEASINFVDASSKLPYMLACLDEAMRIHPPIPSAAMARVVPADGPHKVAGEVLPPNTSIVVHGLSTLTTSPNFYDPLSYHPERWLSEKDERFNKDDKTSFQPFSYGPRNCIGRNLAYSKMRIVLARVLWNFDLELCPESDDWDQQKIYTFWDVKPLWVRLKERKIESK